MMFDEYEKKISKIAKFNQKLYNIRFLIFSVIGVGAIITGTLVGIKGVVTNNVPLSKTYVYGDVISYRSSGLMSNIQYEFAEASSDNWTSEKPYLVGNYKMRAKSLNNFNSYYYGSVQKFSIIPKTIDIECYNDSITYGETPKVHLNSNLLFDDKLNNSYTFEYDKASLEKWNITPIPSSLKITDGKGNNVTYCYNFVASSKEVTIYKRAITVSTPNDSKTYDGTELYNDNIEVISGSLADGDNIVSASHTSIKSVGVSENVNTYQVFDSEQNDVTKYYSITTDNGSLEIYKRTLSLSSGDFEYTYDGEDKHFDKGGISIDDDCDGLADDQKLSYTLSDFDCVKAGEYENSFEIKVIDNGTDVSSNYDIAYSYGTTTINKRSISILSDSGEITYDGSEFKVNGYSITEGELATKDELSSEPLEGYSQAGTYDNVLALAILDKDTGEDFTDSYEINESYGSLVINQRKIAVTIEQSTVTYDGFSHACAASLTSGSMAENDNLVISSVIEQTAAGTYDSDATTVSVIDNNGIDRTDNYEIELIGVEEALKINKRELNISINQMERIYNDTKIKDVDSDDVPYALMDSTSLADNEYIYFDLSNEDKDVGTVLTSTSITIYHQKGMIRDIEQDSDVTSNYDLTYSENNFITTKRPITISTVNYEYTYNRAGALPADQQFYEIDTKYGLVSGHTISGLDISCSAVNVGTYGYDLSTSNFKILDAESNDVTSNYKVTFINDGQVTINKRDVQVTLVGGSKVYDGTSYSTDEYTSSNLLSGDYLTFDNLPSVKHVSDGYLKNVPSGYEIYTSAAEIVTSNYNVNFTYKTINIEPRPIILTSTTIQKVFDNVPIKQGTVEITSGSLAPGDSMTIDYLASRDDALLHASTSANNFTISIKNGDGENVISDYDIKRVYGDITISPLKIDLGVKNHKYEYDGLSHSFVYNEINVKTTSSDIYIISGTLPTNFTVNAYLETSEMKNVGSYSSFKYQSIVVYYSGNLYGHQSDFDLTLNTTINKQEITRRNITVRSSGGTKIYDGKPFGYGESASEIYSISMGSLASGDYIVFTLPADSLRPTEPMGEEIQLNPFGSITIYNSYGTDVTNNYNISYILGEVIIYEE